jgi:hypothetical protein
LSSQPDALMRIIEVLKTGMHVEECADVVALHARDAASGAALVTAKPLRIGDYYDVQPPVTIYDPRLGTLAFIEQIARDQPEAASLTWKAIERAAAVRQILIAAAEQRSRESANDVPRVHTLALQVELVLVVSGAATGDDPVRTTLTGVARQTGYLRLIGLSVIDTERPSSLETPSLRRAFAWLLRSTTKWLAGVPQMDDAWRAGGERLRLALQDYRMAGSRQFECDGSTWLNLVHGHNGSGKSSLAEAVELLLTGRIQRIDEAQEGNYFRVLRHRTSGLTDADLATLPAAEVKVYGTGTQPLSTVRLENQKPPARTGRTPHAQLQANSFRIDQVFMDKLIRSRAAERAVLFLNAFSPGDAALLASLQRLRAEVRKAWHPLPEHVRRKAELQHAAAGTMPIPEGTPPPPPIDGEIPLSSLSEEKMAEVILRELGPLQGLLPDADTAAKGAVIPAAAIEILLPGERKELAPLATRFPGFMERVDALLKANTAADLRAEFGVFQSALQSFRTTASNGLGDVSGALRVFHEYRSWNASGRVTGGGDFEADLRRWLELQALVDLTTKYGDVVTTLDNAQRAGWQPDGADRKVLRLDTPLSGPARLELSER